MPDEALLYAIALVQRQLRSLNKPAPAAGAYVCGAGDVTQDQYSAVRVPCVHLALPSETPPENAPAEAADVTDADAAGGAAAGAADSAAGAANGAAGGANGSLSGGAGGSGQTRFRLVVFQLLQASIVLLVEEDSPNHLQPTWYTCLAQHTFLATDRGATWLAILT